MNTAEVIGIKQKPGKAIEKLTILGLPVTVFSAIWTGLNIVGDSTVPNKPRKPMPMNPFRNGSASDVKGLFTTSAEFYDIRIKSEERTQTFQLNLKSLNHDDSLEFEIVNLLQSYTEISLQDLVEMLYVNINQIGIEQKIFRFNSIIRKLTQRNTEENEAFNSALDSAIRDAGDYTNEERTPFYVYYQKFLAELENENLI